PSWGGGRGAGAATAGQPAAPRTGAAAPAATSAPDVAQRGGRGAGAGLEVAAAGGRGRQRPLLEDGNLAQTFPTLDAKANVRLKLLYVVCGTADDHLDL